MLRSRKDSRPEGRVRRASRSFGRVPLAAGFSGLTGKSADDENGFGMMIGLLRVCWLASFSHLVCTSLVGQIHIRTSRDKNILQTIRDASTSESFESFMQGAENAASI